LSEDPINEAISSAITALGYCLLGVEWVSDEGVKILRVFIDSPQGITADDCAQVSRQINAVLDVSGLISDQYSLEVSSPGINRRLFTIGQAKDFIGSCVKVRLRSPLQERRNFVGTLCKITDNDELVLSIDGRETIFPWGNIEKAKLRTDI